MAFNFGAFLGGMSRQIVKGIEEEEERQFKFDMLAEEEATRMRLSRASERRAERKAQKEQAGLLKSLGYTDAQASWIMKGGAGAVNIYSDHALKAQQKGIDVSKILSSPMISSDVQDPRNESKMMSVLGSREDIPKIESGVLSLDKETVASIYGKEEKDDPFGTLQAGLSAAVTEKYDALNKYGENSDEYKDAVKGVEFWQKEIKALDPEDKDKPVELFSKESRGTIIRNAEKTAYTNAGFGYDLEKGLTETLSGKEAQGYVAELSAAEIIAVEAEVEGVTDQRLMSRAVQKKNNAFRSLRNYGQATLYKVKNPDAQVVNIPQNMGYFKNERNEDGTFVVPEYKSVIVDSNRGAYGIGDVIVVKEKNENGQIVNKIKVYIGKGMAQTTFDEYGDQNFLIGFVDAGQAYLD